MEKHGFQLDKLKRNLDALLGGWVDSGDLPCAQALVIRRGEVAYEGTFGWADLEAKAPLKSDAIYRAYSMSKVFTSVCMMMLHEQARYKMHDPLSKFIPEFKQVKVAEYDAAGHLMLVKPHREIVIRDLFTMASGIPYPDEGTASERAMGAMFKRADREGWDTQRIVRETAKAPLTAHPGEHWWYGFSIDVLGALVEVLSGQKLSAFMQERIFNPLRLKDTGFWVPEHKLDRFVRMYEPDAKGRFTKPVERKDDGGYYAPPPFESGGGGLVSTAHDVGRLAQMLLGFGALDGVRLISRKSVELMRTNHLSEQQLKDYNWDTQRGYGYGLAVRTMMHPEVAGYGSVGEFGWDGMAGTWFSVDPSEDLVMVFMVQINPGMHYQHVPYFAQTVYGAIGD